MTEDDPTPECCPICQDKQCKVHLLGCFDASEDEGELGVGLVDGPLYDVKEIKEVLQRARLAWVRSVRATGKPKAPQWIMKEQGLRDYFDALGGLDPSALEKCDSDADAARDLQVETENEIWHAREEFLREGLSSCGWLGERTQEPFDSSPGMSTTYLSWWAFKPSEIVERFSAKLQGILLDANSTVALRSANPPPE